MFVPFFRRHSFDLIMHCVFILLVSVIVFLPQYQKNAHIIPEYVYTRPHGLIADYYYYLSVINRGRISWWEINPYSTEPAKPSQIHAYYIVLGKIASVTGLSNIDAYYLGMYVPLLLTYIFTFLFIRLIFGKRTKWIAMAVILFTGPFPAVTLTVFGHPLYIGPSWWSKMDQLTRLTHVPHHFIASALMIGSSWTFLSFHRSKRLVYALFCSLFAVIGIYFYTLPGFIFFTAFTLVVGCGFLLKKIPWTTKHIAGYSMIAITCIVSFAWIYFQLTQLGQPWNKNLIWEYQAFRPEHFPIVWYVYFFNFGVLTVFSFIAVPFVLLKKNISHSFTAAMVFLPYVLWALVVYGILQICKIRLAYSAPYVFAGSLATFGIESLTKVIRMRTLRIIVVFLCMILLSANAVAGIAQYWWPALKPDEPYGNVYIHTSYFDAMAFMNSHITPSPNVFTDLYTGMYLPAFTHTTAYIGHEVSTLDFKRKSDETNRFFEGNMTTAEINTLFTKNSIAYIYWDTCFYFSLPVSYYSVLKEVYKNACVTIFTPVRSTL